MFRVNILGKVGYFKDDEDIFNFVKERFEKNDFDIILNDLRCGVDTIKNDFLRLRSFNSKNLIGRRKMIYKNNLGVRVANFFMGFRYRLRVEGKKSVEEVLKNEDSLRKVIKKILILGRKKEIELNDFFTFASLTAGGQKLGNFMPVVAKAIYELYCQKENARILDISAGFGGRLVGAMSSKFNYEYVGVDPSTKAVEGLNNLIGFLNVKDRAKIIKMPFEDTENILEGKFDFCFTSPPYFKKEIYSEEETQSYKRYPEIEMWRVGFLKKSFEIVMNKLSKNCYMLINIANIKVGGKVYNLEELTKKTAKEVGFKYEGYKIMEMARMPGIGKKFKTEKVFIFKKQ
ncbi:MAG TPA: class I SAM-dependent methyltransferase [Candidatus Pacearchaeota archaeon]|nr:class I SAM-dependent methyltransferase [Candidatus Pacearchaeota archaeon]HPZ75042.1 class I SAM-dependent methyltransferase [Candidatus Pacearchaeota archaeon]